ncbi:MAG: NfeD family protein [Clostridium sp.]|nr:NfeD family protein [Clostridium sp.]MCM1546882.1 NfeD family protein [Ruminococcus sp.]
MGDLILWGAVFAVMVIAELASMQLVSIWFAAGALASFITALCGMGMGMQMVVFVIVSIVLLVGTRPLLKKFRVENAQPTNIDLDIGKTAIVIENIDNSLDTGRAKLNGVDWKAVSADDSVISEGSIVRIEEIKGTKLFVTLVKEPVKN